MKKIFRISVVFLFVLPIFLIYSCKKENNSPILTTTTTTNITQTTTTSGGSITDDGGLPILSKGVCWSTNNVPTISDNKTLNGTGVGSFESIISGLLANNIYFISAYATNASGTGYGNVLSFTTLPATTPILTTTNITNITQNTASAGGSITSDGAASIMVKGICWSTNQNPTISDSKTSDGTGIGSYTSSITGLIGNTTYYVRAYATNNTGTGYGTQVSFISSPVIPTLTTLSVSSITSATCSTGGTITSDGGTTITDRGVCWSTTAIPTILNSKTTDGSGIGIFSSALTSLTANTTYYVRAYASNIVGTGYGNQYSFITLGNGQISDIDGNIYKTVAIGTQVWMAENLKTTKFSNGNVIGTTIPATLDIRTQSTPKYQWAFNGNESLVATYGRLYTWFAVTDIRNICPTGWHVPTVAEWATLTDYLINNGYGYGGSGDLIGKSMASTSGWTISTELGDVGNDQMSNNSSGFSGLPAGYRDGSGQFVEVGFRGFWWSYGQGSTPAPEGRQLNSGLEKVYNNGFSGYDAISVRCVKN